MKTNTSIGIVLAALVLFSAVDVFAQNTTVQKRSDETLQFGLFVGGILNTPSSSFATLPGVLSCQGDSILFESGSGGGVSAALVVGMKPSPGADFLSHLGWNLKIGFTGTSTSFETEERIGQAISPTGELSPIFSRYTIDGNTSSLMIEPTLLYQLSNSVPLLISVGPNLGYLVGATFDQKEEIASPANAQFADQRTARNVLSGDIEETSSLQLGLVMGLGLDIELSPLLSLRPQISGLLSMTNVASDTDWKQHSLRGGISVLFNLAPLTSTPLSPTE